MATNVHRFKSEGGGRIKSYSCSCGNWGMTGSEKIAKAARKQWEDHAEKGGLSKGVETAPRDGGEPQE